MITKKMLRIIRKVELNKFGGPGSGPNPGDGSGSDDVESSVSTNSNLSTEEKSAILNNVSAVNDVIKSKTSDENVLDDSSEKINESKRIVTNNKNLNDTEKTKIIGDLNKMQSKLNSLYED